VRAAQSALIRLMKTVSEYPDNGRIIPSYSDKFLSFINDDLDMPKAVALTWELVKDQSESDAGKKATILDFDRVFGLSLDSVPKIKPSIIPMEIQALADAREEARKEKDWPKADALRTEIESRGYTLRDTDEGIVVEEV